MAKKKDPSIERRNKMLEDLDGFGDVMDLMSKTQKNRVSNITQDARPNMVQSFELHTFLENEFQRLSRLDVFFTQKAPTMREFSQTHKLIDEQRLEMESEKKHLIKKLKNPGSPLHEHLRRVFNGSLY